jgi:hypothetical protein
MVISSFIVPLVDMGIPLAEGGRFLFTLNEFSSFTGLLIYLPLGLDLAVSI